MPANLMDTPYQNRLDRPFGECTLLENGKLLENEIAALKTKFINYMLTQLRGPRVKVGLLITVSQIPFQMTFSKLIFPEN